MEAQAAAVATPADGEASVREAELLAAVRLHLAPLTPRQREVVSAAAGDLGRLASLGAADLARLGVPAEFGEALGAISPDDARRERDRALSKGVAIRVRSDPAYPPLLREIPDPPWALWVRGDLPDPVAPAVAVVGSRRPSPYGHWVTRRLARELAEIGVLVVSGGALGVDGAAHAAALEGGGATVAILGCGVDVAYPRSHAALFERVAASGAVVSEHPCGTEPRPFHFPVRNRLLAGWARAVVVTEAAAGSGSLITARLALDEGRDVLAVPGPVTSPTSAGTNGLIASGARLVRDAVDVLASLPPEDFARLARPVARAAEGARAVLPAEADAVLAALPPGEAVALEELAARTELRAGELLARLVALEAEGLVRRLSGGVFARA